MDEFNGELDAAPPVHKENGLTETGSDAGEPGCSREEQLRRFGPKLIFFFSLTKCGNAVGGIFPAA